MSISWYYIWSEKYRFFHELFQEFMKETTFIVKPIHIDQLAFDQNAHEIEKRWIDILINCLENSDTSYIIFSDVDIIVKSDIYKNLRRHVEENQTMVFLQEGSKLNIRYMLLKVCPEVIEFWKRIRETMQGSDKCQDHLNTLITGYSEKWSKFDDQIFACSTTWTMERPFSILVLLSSSLGKEMDFAEKIFTAAQHLNVEPCMKYLPENAIQSIYTYQELLYLSYKEAKTAPNS